MTFRVRTCAPLAAAWLAAATAAVVAAAPQDSGATRAGLTRWFEELAATGIEVGRPQQWRYAFSSTVTAPLEALSLELVRSGYAIDTLTASAAAAQLRATRTELLTPAALERRNHELTALARKHGARYDSVDVVAGTLTR